MCSKNESTQQIKNIPNLTIELKSERVLDGQKLLPDILKVRQVLINKKDDYFVLDSKSLKFYVFDKNWNLTSTILGEGKGPGEVPDFSSAFFDKNDSLFVEDNNQKLIHVFADLGKGYELTRSFENTVFMHPEKMYLILSKLIPNNKTGEFYGIFDPNSDFGEVNPNPELVQFMFDVSKNSKIVSEPVAVLKKGLTITIEESGLTIEPIKMGVPVPFGGMQYFISDIDGSVLIADSEKGTIEKDGKVVIDFSKLMARSPLKDSDIQRYPASYMDQFRSALPKLKPYFYNFKVAFNGDIYVDASDEQNDKTVIVFNSNFELKGKFKNPNFNFYDIIEISDSTIFVSSKNAEETKVVTYSIH